MAGTIPDDVRALIDSERYCILCTQGDGQPYGSLLCYAARDRKIAFATPRTTRKYALLQRCDRVALVIDNRSGAKELMAIEAVTLTGNAVELTDDDARGEWASLLVERHPDLRLIVHSPSCAVFAVEIDRCIHVSRFQEVFES